MKFSTLITTFKNGLVSPLIRGRKDIDGVASGAEEFENFRVDSIGASWRREPVVYTGNIINTQPTSVTQNFIFTLLGKDYSFSFNRDFAFNDVESSNPYDSKFLTIDFNNQPSGITGPFVFAPFGGVGLTSPTDGFIMWGQRNGVSSGLNDYLHQRLTIVQHTQISDRTIVFTTNSFSFCVSLVNIEVASGATPPLPQKVSKSHFIMYPHFMNLSAYRGGTQLSTAIPVPIRPINYPFNFPNTDTSKIVYVSLADGQLGTNATSGVLVNSDNNFIYYVDIPYSLTEQFFNGSEFEGAFIRVATQDSKEGVYFLTKGIQDINRSGILCRTYSAIQIVGGGPSAAGTSVWSLSTWRDFAGHPKVVTTFKSRLMFANGGRNNLTTIWAAAVNNDNPFDYQGFMEDTLIQDVTTDGSGMKYFNSTNPNRRGFSLAFSDGDGQEIRWMMARNRLHFGTSNGEYQIQVPTAFTREAATQSRIGTISSDFIQPVGGDKKIIYSANRGKELRYISVEDRDYESVDNKINAVLSGLKITIGKIQWYEKHRVLVILTKEGEVYGFSFDSMLQIAAYSKWSFPVKILDIAASNTKCKLFFDQGDAIGSVTLDDDEIPFIDYAGFYHYYDFYKIVQITNPAFDYAGHAASVANLTAGAGTIEVSFYYKEEVFTSPPLSSTENAGSPSFALPSSMTSRFLTDEYILVGVKYKSRVRSMPINEGSQYGSPVGDVHRIDRATFQLFESGKFRYGSHDTPLYTSEGLNSGQVKTKDYTYELPQSSDREQYVVIETDEPTPLTISGVALRGLSNSGE